MGRERYTPEQRAFYKAYINGPVWNAYCIMRLAHAGHRCEFAIARTEDGGEVVTRCPRTSFLEVHHNNYIRLGNELVEDTDVFCWFHHILEHCLWQRCPGCGYPRLGPDEEAEKWLLEVMHSLGINPDNPPHWSAAPKKEEFFAVIPAFCPDCRGFFSKDDPAA